MTINRYSFKCYLIQKSISQELRYIIVGNCILHDSFSEMDIKKQFPVMLIPGWWKWFRVTSHVGLVIKRHVCDAFGTPAPVFSPWRTLCVISGQTGEGECRWKKREKGRTLASASTPDMYVGSVMHQQNGNSHALHDSSEFFTMVRLVYAWQRLLLGVLVD